MHHFTGQHALDRTPQKAAFSSAQSHPAARTCHREAYPIYSSLPSSFTTNDGTRRVWWRFSSHSSYSGKAGTQQHCGNPKDNCCFQECFCTDWKKASHQCPAAGSASFQCCQCQCHAGHSEDRFLRDTPSSSYSTTGKGQSGISAECRCWTGCSVCRSSWWTLLTVSVQSHQCRRHC